MWVGRGKNDTQRGVYAIMLGTYEGWMLYSETVFLATPSQPGASVQRANVRPLRSLRALRRIQAMRPAALFPQLVRHNFSIGGSLGVGGSSLCGIAMMLIYPASTKVT